MLLCAAEKGCRIMMTTIDIAQDFSRFPRRLTPKDGPANATTFRQQHLVPVLENNDRAIVILDGVGGYSASFLNEAFGGLVRKEGYSAKHVFDSFEFRATKLGYGMFVRLIKKFVERADNEIDENIEGRV